MRRTHLLWLIAPVAVLALPFHALHARDGQEARAAMARGMTALERGDPRTARVEFMNAIKADPDWAPARIAQARAYLSLGDGIAAKAELDRARALGANPSHTRHLMADALLRQGRAEDALKEAKAGDVIAEQRAYAARIAGLAHEALGQNGDAAGAFNAALALEPDNPEIWTMIGRFRLATGDTAGAVAASEKAVALAPGSPDALTLRGILVRDQYGLAASLPWFDRALALDRNFVPALTEYAATLADMGQARRMLALTRRIIALEPRNPRAFMMQAVMAARAGKDDLARGMLGRTNGVLDDEPATLLLRGILYANGGNATLAAEQFATLVRRQPLNMRARLLLGKTLYEAAQLPEAAAALAPIVERGDADSYALTLAARIQEQLGNGAAAVDLLARAAAPVRADAAAFAGAGDPALLARDANADPAAAAPNILYIRALLQAGQVAAAIDRASALRAANRGAPAAHIIHGDALAAAGRYADAARAYEQAANIRFSEDVALRLMSTWRRAGRIDKAVDALSLYLGQNPASIVANRLAASAWIEGRDWDRAIAALDSLRARLGNEDALLMADLAWAWLGKGDGEKALAYAAHAYRLQPASPVASHIFGWALQQARGEGGSQPAIDLLEKAASLAPDQPLLQMHLGTAYAAAGRKQDAFAALSRAANSRGFALQAEARAALARL